MRFCLFEERKKFVYYESMNKGRNTRAYLYECRCIERLKAGQRRPVDSSRWPKKNAIWSRNKFTFRLSSRDNKTLLIQFVQDFFVFFREHTSVKSPSQKENLAAWTAERKWWHRRIWSVLRTIILLICRTKYGSAILCMSQVLITTFHHVSISWECHHISISWKCCQISLLEGIASWDVILNHPTFQTVPTHVRPSYAPELRHLTTQWNRRDQRIPSQPRRRNQRIPCHLCCLITINAPGQAIALARNAVLKAVWTRAAAKCADILAPERVLNAVLTALSTRAAAKFADMLAPKRVLHAVLTVLSTRAAAKCADMPAPHASFYPEMSRKWPNWLRFTIGRSKLMRCSIYFRIIAASC
jgi:hypothetical protein